MIPNDTIERIISLAKIEEVVGDFVALRRAGSNYKGCCPFHDEKTPSFVVSPAKGIYKCFGCGKAGNAVTFIKEQEKCSYYDAIRYLGRKYHVEIIETELSDEEKQKRDVRESLQIINQFAADFFEKSMWETDEGKSVALSYFYERGFTEATIRKFRLGYSPQKKDAFTKDAEAKGYKLEYLSKLGLTSVGENYKIDRFHGRVMFPIMSVSGTVIGFGGRVLTAANEHVASGAKYVNSPESEVYNKSRTLYGISFAKNEIVKKDECILVEGYTDVISMHQAGITNVVASSGTSLTNEQIDLIKRFTQNIVVIYDGDNAGIKASVRGIDMILEKDLNVRVLLLPNNEDPDTFAQNHTSEEISEYIDKNKVDFLTFRTRIAAEETKNDPIERAKFITSIATTIAKIPNEIKRTVFIQECGKILSIDERSLSNQVATILGQPIKTYKTAQVQQVNEQRVLIPVDTILSNEKDIIRVLLLYGNQKIFIKKSRIMLAANKKIAEYKNIEVNLMQDSFEGLVKDYIKRELEENQLFLLNENEKKIYDEYFSHSELDNDALLAYIRDYVDAERVANILTEAKIDEIYWRKNKVYHTEDNEEFLNEQTTLLITETIQEYAKRRYEAEKHTLCEQKENLVDNLEKILILSYAIDELAKQLRHTSR